MAQPASRSQLKDYCLRQLGAPVLEINVADEQVDDIIDDALQYFYERHFDGVMRTYLKYQITQDDIDRGKGPGQDGVLGITTTTAEATIDGATMQFDWEENSNYLQVPPSVIGIEKVFHFDGSQSMSSGMFSIKYQLFLNDIYFFGAMEMLTYNMTRTYLSDLEFALTTQKQFRFNQRQDRLYLDISWSEVTAGDYLVIDCFRTIDANDYVRVWNDSFLKRYTTALLKRQWGQNLLKFQGVKLPGGVELDGRAIYEDGMKDLEIIRDMMSNTYELPPLDMIG
jgi:hypothetical protein|tara:strand:- start:12399 stop:13244 length:846 start_codon:yes stop_codon:yes gene_type:complete